MDFKPIIQKKFIQYLTSQGANVYFVGGCVRDHFMELEPKDIDLVVTHFEYDKLNEILTQFGKTDLVGKSFGVIKFKEFETDWECEIALPRSDSKGEGKGHTAINTQSNPFLSIEEDLYRRDFTINSIAISHTIDVINPFNGIRDILERKISATNKETFQDDPLRILRAIQFAARFSFKIGDETMKLIQESIHKIKEISPERVLMEFQKVFDKKGNLLVFNSLLDKTGLYYNYFGHNWYTVVFDSFKFMETSLPYSRTLPEWLYYNFASTHENNLISFLQEKLKIDNETVKQIKAIQYFFNNDEENENIACFNTLKIYQNADKITCLIEFFENFNSRKYPRSMNELALTGDQIKEKMGIEEGPKIGEIRKKVLMAILDNEFPNNYEYCLDYAMEHCW